MSEFTVTKDAIVGETEEQMEQRHELESQKLENEIKGIMKQAKKANKAELEAKIMQMRYDLRAKHRDEIDLLIESGGDDNGGDVVDINQAKAAVLNEKEVKEALEKLKIAEKKNKVKLKKDKRAEKDAEKRLLKEEIKQNAGPNMRDIELAQLNEILAKEGLKVKEVPADGHCMYRAIADQLRNDNSSTIEDLMGSSTLTALLSNSNSSAESIVACLRAMTAEHILKNKEEYAPFLDIDLNSSGNSSSGSIPDELFAYCNKVRSMESAEWGGQVELNVLSALLSRPIVIYDLTAPSFKIKMGEGVTDSSPIKVAYHRHFYALGEHYNSTQSL